jgi:hypothetical protein
MAAIETMVIIVGFFIFYPPLCNVFKKLNFFNPQIIRSGGQASGGAMRYCPVTTPAFAVELLTTGFCRVQFAIFEHLGDNFIVTVNTIVLYPLPGAFAYPDILTLIGFECHGIGMIEAVPGFCDNLVNKRLLWQMAIHTGGPLPVRTVLPGGILGVHGMAIDAYLRVFRHI